MKLTPVILVLSVIVLSVFVNLSTSIVIDCKYHRLNPQSGTSLYGCVTENVYPLDENDQITDVTGKHLSSRRNKDVQAIKFSKSGGSFPSGLSKFFPNLKFIDASNTTFDYIDENSFKDLKSLENVFFHSSEIQILFKDTFANLPSIKSISFVSSQIRLIENGFFESLPQSSSIELSNNPCMENISVYTIPENKIAAALCELPIQLTQKLETFKGSLDETRMSLELTETNLTNSANLNQVLTKAVEKFTDENSKLREANEDLLKELDDLKANLPRCNSEDDCKKSNLMKKCEKEIEEIIEKVKNETMPVENVKATCNYESDMSSLDYTCYAVNLVINKENSSLLEPTGNQAPRKTNNDVTTFAILNQNIISLPSNIDEKFPSITKLIVRKSNLVFVHKLSFYLLVNLKSIDLQRNSIKIIEAGIFDLNVRLERIDLSYNQITVLPPALLKNLPSLSFFAAAGNQLAVIDKNFFVGSRRISVILLNDNKISYIPQNTFAMLKKILSLDLLRNVCINEAFDESSIVKLDLSLAVSCQEDMPCA